ncbi:MAG: ABC transporter ATP-binding protein, partial [Clostridia bacterium]|nr:ABC transporter ATP-binding protein [Clostridia bacterium]
ILKDAPIVVLDEATAFADPENEALIQKAFAALTEGRTVIMIAHRLSTVIGADKVIVLSDGRVVEEGTHEELARAGGLYSRMWADYNQAVTWRIAKEEEV